MKKLIHKYSIPLLITAFVGWCLALHLFPHWGFLLGLALFYIFVGVIVWAEHDPSKTEADEVYKR